jgi:flavin-dependent dehydrogenase
MSLHDVAVIGAGPAGATAAIRLAQAGMSVLLAEKTSFPRRKVCGEFISTTTWPLLDALGVGAVLAQRAGPAVHRVGLFHGERVIEAAMPPRGGGGRAVGREWLDTALRDRAVAAGVALRQPARVLSWARDGDGHRIEIDCGNGRETLHARRIVDAHGSWERLRENEPREPHRASDLLGFKAHFRGASLAAGLMPLVLFPGGYGGMVASDGGRVSFSCCVRRDALADLRAQWRDLNAGEAVIAHVSKRCRGVREALAGARCEDAWLSAGPIRPGIRTLAAGAVFHAGNAAGEAHPLVAEGISMAIQAGWLAAGAIAAGGDEERSYAASWRRHFASRVRASSFFASLMLRPWGAAASAALLESSPAILTWGAWWSGKSHALPLAPA